MITDPLFRIQAADYAPTPSDEPRLPLLTATEARLVVDVLIASDDPAAGWLGRDLADRISGE